MLSILITWRVTHRQAAEPWEIQRGREEGEGRDRDRDRRRVRNEKKNLTQAYIYFESSIGLD